MSRILTSPSQIVTPNARGQSTELLRTDLLYYGARARQHTQISQASAELEQFHREYPLAVGGLAREMSAPFFADNPGANITGAVAFVDCKTGQTPHQRLPLNTLMQLVGLERYARAYPGVASFALVGLESANRGMVSRSGSQWYETLCRYAFKIARFVETNRALFSRVTPLLDCEVLNSNDALAYSRQRKEHDIRDSDRVATAVRALGMSSSGIQLKVGASNFTSSKEIENAKRRATREQMHLFLGQTNAEDEQLKGELGFLYTTGPASRRLGQLVILPDEIQNAAWLQVDHLAVSEAEFKQAWAEHEQIDGLFKVIHELNPALCLVDESLAWTLDCSQRMLEFHDGQLYEISTHKTPVTQRTLENLKRDYSRAMRTYLRDLAARNFDWLVEMSQTIGFQVEGPATTRSAQFGDDEIAPLPFRNKTAVSTVVSPITRFKAA